MRHHKRRWYILTAGRWPWKSEPAKDCVTTHLPNVLALKMDGAEASHPYPAPGVAATPRGVGGRGGPVAKPRARARVERPPVQILVAVANTSMGT